MTTKLEKLTKFGLTVFMCLSLSACASTQMAEGEVHDPLEGMNRATLSFNEAIDNVLLEPLARGYRAAVPSPVRTGVRNFLRNLRSPINFANQVLQGDIEGAASDFTRAAVNTTIGIGGLIDVAHDMGLEYEQEDFGQTLAVWGVDHGPYLVMPIMGPSSFRDATGIAVDAFADPLRIYLFNTDREGWHYARVGATAIDKREEFLDVLDDLQKNSFDYYAALRSAYIQRRAALVRDEDPETAAGPAIPDYDDEDY